MKQQLMTEYFLNPLHSGIQGPQSRGPRSFVQATLERLPEDVVRWIAEASPPIVLVATSDVAVTRHCLEGIPAGADLIFLGRSFFRLPRKPGDTALVVATLAHEFAHCRYRRQHGVASAPTVDGEIAVDAIAASWGVREDLSELLKSIIGDQDLGSEATEAARLRLSALGF